MVQNTQTIINTAGAGLQAAAQGTNALAKTAAQVNQAAQQVSLGAATSLAQPIQVAITEIGSSERKLHRIFQLPLNPTAEQIDAAVEQMVKGYFIVTEAELKRIFLSKSKTSVTDFMENFLEASHPFAKEFSEELRPVFWDSLKRHVVAQMMAHIMKWDRGRSGSSARQQENLKMGFESLFNAACKMRFVTDREKWTSAFARWRELYKN